MSLLTVVAQLFFALVYVGINNKQKDKTSLEELPTWANETAVVIEYWKKCVFIWIYKKPHSQILLFTIPFGSSRIDIYHCMQMLL